MVWCFFTQGIHTIAILFQTYPGQHLDFKTSTTSSWICKASTLTFANSYLAVLLISFTQQYKATLKQVYFSVLKCYGFINYSNLNKILYVSELWNLKEKKMDKTNNIFIKSIVLKMFQIKFVCSHVTFQLRVLSN